MRVKVWGHSGQPGGVGPGAAASGGGDYLVLINGRGPAAAVGMRLDPEAYRAESVWVRELPTKPRDLYLSGQAKLPVPSVIDAGAGRVYLLGDGAPLLVKAETGAVLAKASAPVTPSALAALSGSELLVPAGLELVAYDADTLALEWRRPTPEGLRPGAPANGLVPLHSPRRTADYPSRVALWHFESDRLFEVAGSVSVSHSSAPVLAGSLVVLSCDVGAGDRLVALFPDTGTVAWSAETPPPTPTFFRGPFSAPTAVGPSVVADGDRLVSVNQVPSVEARTASTGELLWRVELADPGDTVAAGLAQATALAVIDRTVWVATHERDVLAADAATGTVRGETRLDAGPDGKGGVGPHNFTPMAGFPGSSAVVAVGSLGTIYGITI